MLVTHRDEWADSKLTQDEVSKLTGCVWRLLREDIRDAWNRLARELGELQHGRETAAQGNCR